MHQIWYIVIVQFVHLNKVVSCVDINKFHVVQNGNITVLESQLNLQQQKSLLQCLMLCNADSECHSGSFDKKSKECVRDHECSHKDSQSTYNFALIGDTRAGNKKVENGKANCLSFREKKPKHFYNSFEIFYCCQVSTQNNKC